MARSIALLAGTYAVAAGIAAFASPGAANAGFLDQLFGGATATPSAPMPAPAYDYPPPAFYQDASPVRPRIRKRVVDDKPKLQKPTDLMHDATLQTGDAVMMKGGIAIYTGDDGDSHHVKSDFEKLDAVRGLSKQERRSLVAMDVNRQVPTTDNTEMNTISSGRSAAIATPIVRGQDIVDARGKTVRYVGP